MADVIPAAVQRGFSDKFYEKRKIAALEAGGTWFVNSPEESLGFILADHGFDVNWVGNVCGTHWSHGHVTLSVHDRELWDWSWQKLAENDLAAIIGYVYSKTNSKVYYVGHSQLLRDLVFFNSAISTFNDIVNMIFSSPATVAAFVAYFLDCTLLLSDSAKRRGRGWHWWEKYRSCKSNTQSEEFYALPYNLSRRWHWWEKYRSYKSDTQSEEFYALPYNLNRFFPPI